MRARAWALRLPPPPPIAASLLLPKWKNVFLQAQTRGARGIYFSLGYAAPYWATLHLAELCCTLLSFAAPFYCKLCFIQLSYELRCILWAKLHPSELRCRLFQLSTLPPRSESIESARPSFQSSELGSPPTLESVAPPLDPRGESHTFCGWGIHSGNPGYTIISRQPMPWNIMSPDLCPAHRSYAILSGK